MKRLIFAVFIIFTGYAILPAQLISKAKIENVEAVMAGEKIEVSFFISHTSKNENVGVELKFQNGDKYIYPKSITGSTELLSAGKHTIVWDVLNDVEELQGEIKPIISIIETSRKLKAQNAFVPGFNSGNKFLATVSYACIITGTVQLFSANQNFKSYKAELENSSLRTEYFDKAVSGKTRSMILIGAGVGLLATNLILARVYNKKYNLAYVSYKNEALCLSYVHTIHSKN
ncbi:MAG: hypothetical protein B6I20_06125 [Bacteroidetes bacterium 4572_117]|nr:MAG: hypothetical protein B6I20_06125 [Bacteroidetes bacterium 4572_117]